MLNADLAVVHVVVGLLMVAGLAGSVLPFLPGPPLIFAGALVHALATSCSGPSSARWPGNS